MSGPEDVTHGLKMYRKLARWWPLLSAPEDYAEEAEFYRTALTSACQPEPRTLLELGSGGGNNASHMKAHLTLTLSDISSGMLAVSRALNPECEHVEGDMRTIRLGREFDCVFVHDAICYMTAEEDLKRTVETAYAHCRPGGAALFAPDHTRETFRCGVDDGGHDGPDRGLRYLEWTWDPDPDDATYVVDYAFLLRETDGSVTVEHDRHVEGLFSRATWLRLIDGAGFDATRQSFEHSDVDGTIDVFVGQRPVE